MPIFANAWEIVPSVEISLIYSHPKKSPQSFSWLLKRIFDIINTSFWIFLFWHKWKLIIVYHDGHADRDGEHDP